MKIQPIRGTHDLFGDELIKYETVKKEVNNFSKIFGFNEIITPTFEATELFRKPLGEQSDVVLKEMYTFSDKNDSYITLRPELTTPTLRAAISNGFINKIPIKLYTFGSCYRRERPQKGRYRQFNQINFEILGVDDVIADAELIILADSILTKLFSKKDIELNLNSLGDKDTLGKFKNALTIYFEKYKNELTEESQKKISLNPLRILDSKNNKDVEISLQSPKIKEFYSKEAENKFNNIQNFLSDNNIKYILNPNLVRGLDYYCHTVFEFKTSNLGSQDTLIGGGRYDGLTKLLGGPDISGVGWAGGVERLMMLLDEKKSNQIKAQLIIIDEKYKKYGFKIANQFRKNNINVHFDYRYNLKKSLSVASNLGFQYAIIIGENEFNNNICTIKFLKTNTQITNSIENIIKEIK